MSDKNPPLPAKFEALSYDAKVVASAWFSLMAPNMGSVVMHMQDNEPTERTQVALRELCDAGLLRKLPFNRYGSIEYTALVKFFPMLGWGAREVQGNKDKFNFQLMRPCAEVAV